TVSLLNFWRYNVAGGGESALYGVEPWHYYLRNGLTTLQGVLPLALTLPLLALLRRGAALKTLETSAPAYVWLLAVSLLPHKEERFLYVVYPLLCLAAAGAAEVVLRGIHRALSRRVGSAWALRATSLATLVLLAASAVLGASRAAALRRNYGAPMRLYEALPELAPAGKREEVSVCVGAEWHRF
ncbi:Alg9-like mannosyltransferase, partial [Helicosporidium sp. ATCC 50920]